MIISVDTNSNEFKPFNTFGEEIELRIASVAMMVELKID